jgi:hypothetical protein
MDASTAFERARERLAVILKLEAGGAETVNTRADTKSCKILFMTNSNRSSFAALTRLPHQPARFNEARVPARTRARYRWSLSGVVVVKNEFGMKPEGFVMV